MSRTNPFKKKRRAASQILLMYGEGLEDETFLKYLKSIYHSRDTGTSIKIYNGRGGNPSSVIIRAVHEPGGYSHRIVVLDNDKGASEMQQARQEAISRSIDLIENTPCLEAILLAILNDGKNYSDKQSSWCKSEFESNYLDEKKRTEINEYGKIFPKMLLDIQRSKVSELNKLIALMEGNFFSYYRK